MSKRVLVAMSGGVDSAVAALLLKEQGYDVTGFTLDLLGNSTSKKAIADAQKTAEAVGIPHVALDRCEAFEQSVIRAFTEEYLAGRTPNPCVCCNASVKFLETHAYAAAHGFDYLATGHYARIINEGADGRPHLLRGTDPKKDQSYMLCRVPAALLKNTLFPLGELDKPAVRALAAQHGFVSASAKDSQDICFIPDGDYAHYLMEERGVTSTPGHFVDKSGAVIGQHTGCIRFTLGQRKGLGMGFGKPMFVLSKNTSTGDVTLGDEADLYAQALTAADINWFCNPQELPNGITAKARYSQREAAVTVTPCDSDATVQFEAPQRALTPGQAIVFYHGDEVLGGGTIDKIL